MTVTNGQVTGFSAAETKKYVYLGGSVIRELNGSDQVVKEYMRGLDLGGGIGSIIYQKKSSDYYYYHYNHKGDVVALTEADQDLVAYYEYDAWGNTMSEAEVSGVDNPYRYSTKEWDEKSGLYYFGARYCSPEIGRWTQRDPAGIVDGLNLYIYVAGDPVGLVDPWGKEEQGCYLVKRNRSRERRGALQVQELSIEPPPSSLFALFGGAVGGVIGAEVAKWGIEIGSATLTTIGRATVVGAAVCVVYEGYALWAGQQWVVDLGYATELENVVRSNLPNPSPAWAKLPRGGELHSNKSWIKAKYYCMRNNDLIADFWRKKGEWTYFERWKRPCSEMCADENLIKPWGAE